MESNKLLIGLQFINEGQEAIFIELIVLRDMTLRQLFDGIKYGLAKKQEDAVYRSCKAIFDNCMEGDGSGVYKKICLTSHNNTRENDNVINNRFVIKNSDFGKTLAEAGFISSTRVVFDPAGNYVSFNIVDNNIEIIPAFNPNDKNGSHVSFPDYNISTRQLYKFNNEPVEIIPPSDPPAKNEQNLFFTLLPTLLMVSMMVLVRGIMASSTGSDISMVILSAAMSGISLVMALINWFRQKRKYKKDVIKWKQTYQGYADKTIEDILERQKKDSDKLNEIYPDINDIFEQQDSYKSVYGICGDIFSRCSTDKDFLAMRLGVSDQVENLFEIKGTKRDVIFSAASFRLKLNKVELLLADELDENNAEDGTHYLTNLPKFISDKYHYMRSAPLMFSIKDCGALGIIAMNSDYSDRIIHRMIFDLSFYHSPSDLQFVILFKPTEDRDMIEKCISQYKFLPHFRELFPDRSQFVFDATNANKVFSNMLNILGNRAENSDGNLPHIVFIVNEEYDLKEHAFAQFLPTLPPDGKPFENKLGITFVFPKVFKEHLPKYCDHVITVQNDHKAHIASHDDEDARKIFTFRLGASWNIHMYNASKVLSALCYSKISENGKVPSNVSLFELYGLAKNHIDIGAMWMDINGKRPYNIVESIAVPIGKTENGVTYLDLHENFDGPHMLVAGTTGSGKSETIITYLLGLCLCFRPDEVNLMLVDMKGGGFVKRIGDLPHVVGSVTDVDGDENGTGAEYMLKRFLNSLTSEIRRRKILFNSMYVDNINQYIAVCNDIHSHINSINNRLTGENKPELTEEEKNKLIDQAKTQSLAHLFLVVDEFTELKRFTTENNDIDFIGEITTIARVGRSLGLHIILISQNIEGAITDDIRVNSKSRLCLKVATKQASKEMIGNDLAASPTMPGHGRAYLLVGTGSKFEYFQSGYAGATAEENMETSVEIVEASKNGTYTGFYRSAKDNLDMIKRKKELELQGKLETQLNTITGEIKKFYNMNSDKMNAPHIIFQRPLSNNLVYEDKRIYEYKDGRYEVIWEV